MLRGDGTLYLAHAGHNRVHVSKLAKVDTSINFYKLYLNLKKKKKKFI